MAKKQIVTEEKNASTFNGTRFRQVLSRWPTGVSIVSSVTNDGSALGVIIGSFGSISMNPPLVAFSLVKTSSSLQAIREAEKFCVNVLSSEQAHLVDIFCKGKPTARFSDMDYSLSPSGLPIVPETLAWIDATVEHEYEGGDHSIVLGRVQALGEGVPGSPLIFAQGTLGAFGEMEKANG